MFNPKSLQHLVFAGLFGSLLFWSGCIKPKSEQRTATLLKASDATQDELQSEINYLASVNSMRAKMDLIFEDNSFAEFGSSDLYRSADGDVVVQRPANIRLKIEVPIIGTDVAQMTSDGTHFRVAILQDGGSGKNRKFILGTNSADYSSLQKRVEEFVKDDPSATRQSVSAFANLRPQHFTEALLVRPIDTEEYIYLMSSVLQEEVDVKLFKKKNPLGWVLRSYYLLDEFKRNGDGHLKITRRFWFDRVGGALLARQQIFDAVGEIESDVIYGKRGLLTADGSFNLPLEVTVTRPKERYRMTLKYQSPVDVTIGREYPPAAFLLQNEKNLEVLDLDQKLSELNGASSRSANPLAGKGRQN